LERKYFPSSIFGYFAAGLVRRVQLTSDWLEGQPRPDSMLIGREGYDPIFDQQTSMKGAPPNSHFGKDFPFMLYKCSLTNFGKGVASGVELKVKVRFGDQASLMSGLGRFSEPQYLSIKVPILPPLASYVFLVGSRNALTASVQPAQEITYHVMPGPEEITEPLSHKAFNSLLLLCQLACI
jgi:hypothetical protein